MNGENKVSYKGGTLKGGYSFSGNNTDKRWIVCLEIKDGKLYEKLRSRGKSVGLKWVDWTRGGNWINGSADIADKAWQGQRDEKHNVGLFIR